jgi:type 2 lantibiotic biosynthesis protein LanM
VRKVNGSTTGGAQLGAFWWVKGLSLAERLPVAEKRVGDNDHVRERLEAWRLSCGEQAAGEFADRLNLRGFTVEQLAAAMAEPAWAIAGRIAQPEWVAFVNAALARADVHGADDAWPATWSDAFAQVLTTFVATARDDLVARLGDLDLTPDVDSATMTQAFCHQLGHRLATIAAPTLVVELHRARRAGSVAGSDSLARFRDFVRRIAEPDELTRLLTSYPVLARLLATASRQAAEAWVELLRRYVQDRPAIVADLLNGENPGHLTGIERAVGDSHRQGRATTLLRFESGATVVYKPRSLVPHLRFTQLVEWMNALVDGLGVRSVPALACDGYGWLSFIPHRPCQTVKEVGRFYYRLGALIALLYAVDATDIHYANLIACGDQPMVVDTETLFHPDLRRPASVVDPAAVMLDASVLRLLLLPHLRSEGSGVVDLSGMGGEPGQDCLVAEWANPGTDRMHLHRVPGSFPSADNRPRLGPGDMDPIDYQDALVAGFRVGYQAIIDHRGAVLDLVAGAADDEIRIVVQPSAFYTTLLTESTHPDALSDGLDRDQILDQLCDASLHDPLRRRLLPYELADLWAGDIPLFTGRPGSRALFASRGQRVSDALATSSHSVAQAKIIAMDATDRSRQEWVMAASLAARRARVRAGATVAPLPVVGGTREPDRWLAAARELADDIARRALRDGDAANWLGFDLVDGVGWVVSPMGAGLSDGYCGVAIFLAQLADVLGEPSYAELAWQAAYQLPSLLAGLKGKAELVNAVGCGGFDGFGGIAYAAARLGTLLGRPSLHEASLSALGLADDIETTSESLSLISGQAGCLAAALAVAVETGATEAAIVALRSADRLAALVEERSLTEPPAPGQRWDLLDAASALRSAGTWMSESRYGEAALLAIRRAGRNFPGSDGPLGWCDGVSGTVLTYAEFLSAGGAEFDRLIDRLAQRTMRRDLSLCHGELGMIDALMADQRAEPAWRDQVARIVAMIDHTDGVCGTPDGVVTPGLLRGLAGIGYQVLRAARPDRVPSVLTLSPTPTHQ